MHEAIVSDLRRLLPGRVTAEPGVLDECSLDYGRIVRRRPGVVVRPRRTDDVAQAIRFARTHGLRVVVRGAAHTQGGQTLTRDGLVLDLGGLNGIERIDEGERCVVAGGGTLWRDVVVAADAHGLVPPVLTTNLFTTLGGTHSIGGVGRSSFRHGAQIDSCLALEVVTGSGDVVRCGPDESPELFAHVLGGAGQLAVITRVTHRLVSHAPFARTWMFAEVQRARAFDDLQAVMAAGGVDHVLGCAGVVRDRWIYQVAITNETHAETGDGRDRLPPSFRRKRALAVVTQPFAAFALAADAIDPAGGSRDVPHPGVDVVLPRAAAEEICRDMLDRLPFELQSRCRMALMCLDRRHLRCPLFITPAEDDLLLLTLKAAASDDSLASTVARLHEAADRSVALGATRYLPGVVRLDVAGWREHFGDRWPTLHRLKQRYDPDGVLTSGFIQYEADGCVEASSDRDHDAATRAGSLSSRPPAPIADPRLRT